MRGALRNVRRMADSTALHLDDTFNDLARWLDFDAPRLRRIVAAFHRATVRDMLAMEHAAARGAWHDVRRLADRIAIGCAQIGEARAAECLAPLREAHQEVTTKAIFFAWYGARRGELIGLIDRAAEVAMAEAFADPLADSC
jgi:hypothetical protein